MHDSQLHVSLCSCAAETSGVVLQQSAYGTYGAGYGQQGSGACPLLRDTLCRRAASWQTVNPLTGLQTSPCESEWPHMTCTCVIPIKARSIGWGAAHPHHCLILRVSTSSFCWVL